MKLKALSNYDGDKSTRFGDCILIYDLTSMIVYDSDTESTLNTLSLSCKKTLLLLQSVLWFLIMIATILTEYVHCWNGYLTKVNIKLQSILISI